MQDRRKLSTRFLVLSSSSFVSHTHTHSRARMRRRAVRTVCVVCKGVCRRYLMTTTPPKGPQTHDRTHFWGARRFAANQFTAAVRRTRETRAIRTSVSEIIELAVVMLLVFFCGCCRLVGVPSSPVRAHAPCIIRRNGCTCSPRHIAVLRMQIANIKNAQRTTVCPVARRRRRTILLCAAEW